MRMYEARQNKEKMSRMIKMSCFPRVAELAYSIRYMGKEYEIT